MNKFVIGFLLMNVLVNAYNPTIYELSLRPWLYELTNKYGRKISKLNDIPIEEFQHLKDIGVDYVWLMGIWQLGKYGLDFDKAHANDYKSNLPDFTIDDVIGSPYAITQFVCNSELGTDQDIINLRKKLNDMGLKLMLDFVPNHSAIDSPYRTSNIDYYIRAPPNTPKPYDSEFYLPDGVSYGGDQWDGFWKDTAQWNYWNQDTRNYLKSVVKKIASMSDGMRCDMAMVILNDLFYNKWKPQLDAWGYKRPSSEFWSEAIKETKQQYPNTIFLAEVYWGKEQDLINLGFDYVYEKWLLDQQATLDVGKVRPILSNLNLNYASHSNHFVENHDEPRAIIKFSGKDYISCVAALMSYSIPGARFINHGQLEGLSNKLDVHLRRSYKENGSTYVKWFYGKVLPILKKDVFKSGNWQQLNVTGDQYWKFFAFKWTNSSDKIVVIINYSDGSGYGLVKLSDASSGQQTITEMISGQTYVRSGDDMRNNGLGVVVDGWNAQIFKYF
ncbi:unnamed protein product [Paramecium sonneborni]|uniref:Glycosyl hydrolase family 13 catalytic domain-containing protein n=1 Tax=Paramecium sonneborni TaxID=65129 RepID=A0A8S1MVP2_9CILI|nr:unnamed protein product [Paramecium sonneborni]